MKKLLKILSFISLGIVGLSAMAVMLCYVFRVPLLELFYRSGEEALPVVIPVANAVTLLGQLGAMIWLSICVGDRRFGIWSELLTAGLLGAVLPGVARVLSWVQNLLIGRSLGAMYQIAQSYMNMLWSYATILNGLAVSLALVICGLSMAEKRKIKAECA